MLEEADLAFRAYTSLVNSLQSVLQEGTTISTDKVAEVHPLKGSPAHDMIGQLRVKPTSVVETEVLVNAVQTLLSLPSFGNTALTLAQLDVHGMPVDLYALKDAICMVRDPKIPVPPYYVSFNFRALQAKLQDDTGLDTVYFHDVLMDWKLHMQQHTSYTVGESRLSNTNIWVFPYITTNKSYAVLIVDRNDKTAVHFTPALQNVQAIQTSFSEGFEFLSHLRKATTTLHNVPLHYTHVFFKPVLKSASYIQFVGQFSKNIVTLDTHHTFKTLAQLSYAWVVALTESYLAGRDVESLSSTVPSIIAYDSNMFYRCILHACFTPSLAPTRGEGWLRWWLPIAFRARGDGII
jgi:hypothetical protein